MLSLGLRRCGRPSSGALLCPLCDGSWALRCLSLCRPWPLHCHLCLGSWALLGPLCDCSCVVSAIFPGGRAASCSCRLWGSADAYARTHGCSCAPCAAAHGYCVADRSAVRDGFRALCVVILCYCVAPCLVALGASLSLVSSCLRAQRSSAGYPRCLSLRIYPRVTVPAIRRGTKVSDSERRIATSRPPSCRSAGGRPCSRVPPVDPRIAVPALRLGTKVSDSDCRSAGSRALLEVSGPRSYLSPCRLPAMGIVPCCDSRHRGFGTLRESMYCAVGIAGRGWLPVPCPHPRPLTLAVHTGTVPLATIPRVFKLVPGHQRGVGASAGGGGGARGAWQGRGWGAVQRGQG